MDRSKTESKKNPLFLIFQVFLLGLFVLAFVALVSVLFCKSCETCISADLLGLSPKSEATTPSSKPEALKFIGFGMGGILVALQALMSYKRTKALEDAVSKTEQGQRQERMKNAIEHLGHDKGSVRLGGAYELFHLAEDTLAEDTLALNQTALDILCAHIRQTTGESDHRGKHKHKPSEEVQSLLTLLFVKDHKVFEGLFGNLQGSHLNGIHLEKAKLPRTQLQGANLEGANLERAHLKKAHLEGAHLQEANLEGAYLGSIP